MKQNAPVAEDLLYRLLLQVQQPVAVGEALFVLKSAGVADSAAKDAVRRLIDEYGIVNMDGGMRLTLAHLI